MFTRCIRRDGKPKRKFATKDEAILYKLEKNLHHHSREKFGVYKCKNCKMFHFGRLMKKEDEAADTKKFKDLLEWKRKRFLNKQKMSSLKKEWYNKKHENNYIGREDQ